MSVCKICEESKGDFRYYGKCPHNMSETNEMYYELTKEIYHELTNEVVCPHCGCEYGDSWEFFTDGNNFLNEIECDKCRKKFCAWRDVSVSYSTRKEP